VLTNPEFRERFYQEARVAARIKHANVVTVYDFGETPDGMLYLVMEFLEGMSLGELLKKKGVLPLDQMTVLGMQISAALQCMHENNVIHRDLKPDNIMLVPDGSGGELVKVVDFGVAKILEADARLTRYQARIGSPVYCSPEQYLGQPVDHRTDLYGLGIIFYECLSGRVPFNAVNETELRAAILHKMPPRLDSKVKQVSGHMADLVQWLLAKDPNDRPYHAAEVTKCLQALRRGQRMPQAMPAGVSPIAEGTAQTKRATPNGIVLNDPAVLRRRENQKPATRQKPTSQKEESAAMPARPSVRERATTKHRGRRHLGAFIFLVFMSSAALAVWKVPEFAIARQYVAVGWNDLALRIKSFSVFEKTAKENPGLTSSLRKTIPAPIRPAQTEKAVSPAAMANAPVQPPATTPTEVTQKSEVRPGSNPTAQSIDSRPAATSNKKIEPRRSNTGRRESKKTSNAFVEARSRITPARVDNKPPAPKILPAPPAGMVLIKGAEFKRGDLFGDGNANEKPAHLVRIDGFWIGAHEVTNREYLLFVKATGGNVPEWMNSNSKYHYQTGSDPFYRKLGPALYNLDNPVVGVSWQDAIMYCAWLSLKGPDKYRLPTEAEWELAARGGNNAIKYSWGNGAPLPARGGNVGDEALKRVFPDWPVIWRAYNDNYAFTAPVEKFGPNKLGVFDMTGNVAEWCSDWYEGSYYQKQVWDRPGGPAQGTEKVIRGGSWGDTPAKLRIAHRRSAPPTFRSNNLGFRVVATPP
jgi:formylglycine-generating enzyme required for sulfatase activity